MIRTLTFFLLLAQNAQARCEKNKITTTDDVFDQRLGAVFPMYKDSNLENKVTLFSPESMVSEYILGKSLRAGRPWSSVDDILMPVNTNDHWILVRFNIKGKYLRIYDSIRDQCHDEHVAKTLCRYSKLLPYFLLFLGLWPGKKPKGTIQKLPKLAPLKVSWQNCLPFQTYQDCGAFTMAFA